MNKALLGSLLLLTTIQLTQAQTKVFREVSEEISSQIRTIQQDGALVGYVVFTQLEKASEDSFNYKITIMDENLNDIGTVNFREENLNLQAVSFEQDALCLAYFKSNMIGNKYRNGRQFRKALDNAKNSVFLQFLGLDGKIKNTHSFKATVDIQEKLYLGDYYAIGGLKYPIELKNIPMKGFVCFYGDMTQTKLLVYNPTGEQTWEKIITENAQWFTLLTSGKDAYLLLKKDEKMKEGGFEMLSFDVAESTSFPKYVLKDKQGNSLKVLSFDIDPVTNKPYVSGTIINPKRENRPISSRDIKKGPYVGIFTINFDGHNKNDIKQVCSYWNDGSQSFITPQGYFSNLKAYSRLTFSFRDHQGNTYYTGSSIVRKPRWGTIAISVVTLPLLVPPYMLLSIRGANKSTVSDILVLKQNSKGTLTLDNTIKGNTVGYINSINIITNYDKRGIYSVTNSDTKTEHLVINDVDDIFIYNVAKKKIMRTIPHKDGNIRTNVYPAKEGHVLVSEYNKKEKYTRFSIESL